MNSTQAGYLGRFVGWFLSPLWLVFIILPLTTWMFGITFTVSNGTLLGAFYTVLATKVLLVCILLGIGLMLYGIYDFIRK